ncbi:MAG: efflux RND transporter permease subunit, partial [Candidatus Marinamargulisbacteria bacterium]
MTALIRYMIHRQFLVNLITILVFVGGILAWNMTNKEELPDVTFNVVRVATTYPGASAEDVEFYVTQPLEEALQGLDGIRRITSTSGPGSSRLSVELERSVDNIDAMVTAIQRQVSDVMFPDDVINLPRINVFETTKKAIIDIGMYHSGTALLSISDRIELQRYAKGLKTRLLATPEIVDVREQGYLNEEMTVQVDPQQLIRFDTPLNAIAKEIQQHHIRAPSGTLMSGTAEQVTVLSELNTSSKMAKLAIQGGFDSPAVKLSDLATITDGFEDQRTIFKVNGREAILFNVVKSPQYGILTSLNVVKSVVGRYQSQMPNNRTIQLTFLDDESMNVRNRLSIIVSNGTLGFILIILSLFIFLNKRSGFWVALGIPFTLCFTLIAGKLCGFTINGVTLASIIIVLGIVVDDAIIVAENITRKFQAGASITDAAIQGTREVIPPILASILTTCAAFIPLYFFSGRFGRFVQFIPPIIFFMLLASVIESFFLLPAHMAMQPKKRVVSPKKKWFQSWESRYESGLLMILPKRYAVVLLSIGLLILAGVMAKSQFKFVLFPNEDSREIVLSGQVDHVKYASETATKIQPIEDYLMTYIGKEGVALRSDIARGRRGDTSDQNKFRITLEIVPKQDREKSTNQLIEEIKGATKDVPGIRQLTFRKRRYGQSSGSIFEIIVAENDDTRREALVSTVMTALKAHPHIINVEPDVVPRQKEYRIDFDQEELKRLSVRASSISSTLRTALNGQRLFTLRRNDDEVPVYLTVMDTYRQQLSDLLSIPVENHRNYLIPLANLVNVTPIQAKKIIRRYDQKRTSFIYADMSPTANQSPLEIAKELETTLFPPLLVGFPTAHVGFDGEVLDSRQSKRDLTMGMIAAVALIYLILAILFNSVLKPLRIMLVIPFGVIGVILAFYAHQKWAVGFYAVIGTLGMSGGVV